MTITKFPKVGVTSAVTPKIHFADYALSERLLVKLMFPPPQYLGLKINLLFQKMAKKLGSVSRIFFSLTMVLNYASNYILLFVAF